MAAAITEYNNVTESIEREEYGELEIEQYGWGNEDIGYNYGSHKISNHHCSDSELGLSESEHSNDLNIVYPTVERQIDSVQRFKRKFKCIMPVDTMIWGDYNSEPAMQISIKFRMCEGKDICRSRDEIREWLSGKYILILYNQIVFRPDEFGDSSI